MADIDIKGMTDKLEQNNGCALQFAMQDMHFADKEKVFDKLNAEAQQRPDNHLSFQKKFMDTAPEGEPSTGVKVPILEIINVNSGKAIFDVFKSPADETTYGMCHTK